MPTAGYFNMNSSIGENVAEGNMNCSEPMLPESATKPQPKKTLQTNPDAESSENQLVPIFKETEIDNDVGYASHGTQEDNSQQSHLSVKVAEWQESEDQDEFMQQEDDLDDLLYHFNNFFQEKLETELDNFQLSMRNMLSEQQIHVRQIVHNASLGENLLTSPMNEMETGDHIICSSKSSPTEHEGINQQSNMNGEDKNNNELLTELLSLSCAITTLLHQPKYRI